MSRLEKALASLPSGGTGLRRCLVSGVSTPIKRTLHSTHTDERTTWRIVIDAAVIRQMKLLEVPREMLNVTPELRELPKRFRRLVPEGLREGVEEEAVELARGSY